MSLTPKNGKCHRFGKSTLDANAHIKIQRIVHHAVALFSLLESSYRIELCRLFNIKLTTEQAGHCLDSLANCWLLAFNAIN